MMTIIVNLALELVVKVDLLVVAMVGEVIVEGMI